MKTFVQPAETIELKQKLIRAKVSITEVARSLGLSRGYISAMLNGRQFHRQERVVRFIKQLPE
jgi:transcriptional regulator with XRE-family HTH domain